MTKPKTTDKLLRVLRGGCWAYTVPAVVRAAFRSSDSPSSRYDNVGFRCALRGRAPVEVKP
jgi:formylglycine-generating enzyme required for sulfatase activity